MPMITGAFSFDRRPTMPGDWDHRETGLGLSQTGTPVWTHCSSRGPIVSPRAPLVLAWDGRIDNREDLLLRLGQHDLLDDEIVLAVFERWGVAGFESLVGDWSLALWDRPHRTLHLARDYMGARPLFYYADHESVQWSTDLPELIVRCGRTEALSDAFVAHFMSLRPAPALTPYEGVHAIRPGTCLSFGSSGGVSARRLWTLRAGQIRFTNHRRYEEELRALWRDAVRARLRTGGVVWAELSGGLDSSSVACMADRAIRRGDVAARSLRLVSHATLHSPEGDERRFIAEVERRVGVSSEIVGVEDNQNCADPERAWATPYALQDVGLAMVRRVRAGGGRVILSGRLGDAIMGCQPDNSEAVFDDIASLDLPAAVRKLRAWSRATRKPFVELAWKLLVRPTTANEPGTSLLASRLRAMLAGASALDEPEAIRASKRTLARLVLGYASGGRLDIPLQPPDVVYTYPFAHRPLVEFVLAIPGEQLATPGVTRSLMRRAFAGLLPTRVLNRQSKGYYPPSAFRVARRHAIALGDVVQLESVQRGWIDANSLRQELRAFLDGGGQTGIAIHFVLRLERWLESRRRRAEIPEAKEVKSHAVLNA
ncbi:MAG TPA: asparagine synthase-related protein [Vicinamibacterales bacterium]